MRFVYGVVLLAGLLLVAGCGDNAKKETVEPTVPAVKEEPKVVVAKETQAREAILQYTSLVAQGYAEMNMAVLEGAATANRVAKVASHMEALKARGLKLLAQPEIVQPTTVREVSADRLTVVSDEKWRNSYVSSPDDRETAADDTMYRLNYVLVSVDGRWLVDEISIEKERVVSMTGPDDLERRVDESPVEESVKEEEGVEKK